MPHVAARLGRLFWLQLGFVLTGCFCCGSGSGLSFQDPVRRFDNDADAFKQCLEALLLAAAGKDLEHRDRLIDQLKLPDAKAWSERFVKAPLRQAFLEEYEKKVAPALRQEITKLLAGRLANQQTEVLVSPFESPEDHPLLEAFQTRCQLYAARFVIPGQREGYHWAFFVHDQDQFRYLGPLKSLWPKAGQ